MCNSPYRVYSRRGLGQDGGFTRILGGFKDHIVEAALILGSVVWFGFFYLGSEVVYGVAFVCIFGVVFFIVSERL